MRALSTVWGVTRLPVLFDGDFSGVGRDPQASGSIVHTGETVMKTSAPRMRSKTAVRASI